MQEERLLTRKDEKELAKFDLVIDVAHKTKNRDIFFFPLQQNLKGEIHQARIQSDRPSGYIGRLGGMIPGHRLYIDTKNRAVKVLDRKSLKEWKAPLEEALKIARSQEGRNLRFNSVEADADYGVPEKEWATWMYHIRILVDAGKFRVEKGSVPEMGKIRKMGEIQLSDDGGIPPKDPKKPFWILSPEEEEKVSAS